MRWRVLVGQPVECSEFHRRTPSGQDHIKCRDPQPSRSLHGVGAGYQAVVPYSLMESSRCSRVCPNATIPVSPKVDDLGSVLFWRSLLLAEEPQEIDELPIELRGRLKVWEMADPRHEHHVGATETGNHLVGHFLGGPRVVRTYADEGRDP